MEGCFGILLLLLFGAMAVFISFARYERARESLEQWGRLHGYRIASAESRTFFKGPFFLSAGKNRVVYYFTAQNVRSGNIQSGYACCGGYFSGMWSDQVEVIWDRC